MDLTDLDSLRGQIDQFLWPDEDPPQRTKRKRILLAATDLFVRYGYRRTSVDQIARKAGVAKGTVYLYYRNKAEIVYHAIALEKRAHLERLTGPFVDATLSPLERLQGFIAIALIMSRELPLTASLTRGEHEFELAVQELDESVLRRANERQLLVLFELLEAATGATWSREQLEQRGRLLIDLLVAIATSSRLNTGAMTWDEYAHAMADIIVNGLTNPGAAIPDLLRATSAHPSPESGRTNP